MLPSLRAERSNPSSRNKIRIASSRSLSSGARSRDPLAPRNDDTWGKASGKSNDDSGSGVRSVPVRKSLLRDRHAGALGLARSLTREPARAWRGVCDLCRKLAQAFPDHQGQDSHQALRGQSDKDRAQLLRALRHAAVVRARAFAAYGEHPARAVLRPYRPPTALSYRHRGVAGVGLPRRAAGAAERLSRRGLAALEKE